MAGERLARLLEKQKQGLEKQKQGEVGMGGDVGIRTKNLFLFFFLTPKDRQNRRVLAVQELVRPCGTGYYFIDYV